MSFEIVGKLYKKYATESKSERFQSREFVLEIADGNYPQLIKFQMVQERCQLLDNYNEGDEIKVHFDLRGREWQGKYLTNLNCWRIELPNGNSAQPVSQASVPVNQGTKQSAPQTPSSFDDSFPTLADAPLGLEEKDDLPF
jgi:single-strand DNA-binding protein